MNVFAKRTARKQSGAALLAFLLVFVTAASFALLKDLNATATKSYRDKQTWRALAEAKAALIGRAVSHSMSPGTLLLPDRRADGNYDGYTDCPPVTVAVTNNLLLGRLPWRTPTNPIITNPCPAPPNGLSVNVRDATGERLWYVVSRNLVYDGTRTPSWPSADLLLESTSGWITVRNATGAVVSNQVAFVVFAPGEPLGYQNRTVSTPPPTPRHYLDRVIIGGTWYRNDNADQDFIIYPNSDTTPSNTDQFNDQLLYVTIDELVDIVQKRTIAEAQNALKQFYQSNLYYPFAAKLDDGTGGCDPTTFHGLLPLFNGACAPPASLTLPASFTSNKWNEHINYALAPGCDNTLPPGCSGAVWLTAGASSTYGAIVIGAGRTITQPPYADSKGGPQGLRASPSVMADYLDSVENTDGDTFYDDPGTPTTASYNDRVAGIAP